MSLPYTLALILCWAVAVPVLLVTAVFAAELGAGLLPAKKPARRPLGSDRVVIVIPAHDEAAGIAATIGKALPCLSSNMRLLVLADNCSDDTAAIARRLGVEVVERNEPDRRGKGLALAAARQHLRSDPPDQVIILDADCDASPDSFEALAEAAKASLRPAQGENLIFGGDAPIVRISNFAFFLKNAIRQRGLQRLCGSAMLNGTGMAFPWPLFSSAPLASDALAEDLELGLHFVRAGSPPVFVPEARISSLAASPAAMADQRSRWEAGFLTVARTQALPLLVLGIRSLRWSMIWSALHLMTPPATLLAALNGGAILVAAIAAAGWSIFLPLVALALVQFAALLAILAAWRRSGTTYLAPRALPAVLRYVFWKLLLYRKWKEKPRKEWIRTDRS